MLNIIAFINIPFSFFFSGKLALIELKTSRKPKLKLEYIEDYALQAAAYLGALNFDPEHNFQVL